MRFSFAVLSLSIACSANAAVPYLVKDITTHPSGASSTPSNFTAAGDLAYFYATSGNQGRELWRTDGTSAGTVIVKDFVPGRASMNFSQAGLGKLGSTLFFSPGQEGALWKTDGSAAGTVFVKDVGGNIVGFTDDGKHLFFPAATSGGLWVSDGTAAGTHAIVDASGAPLVGVPFAAGDGFVYVAGGTKGIFRTDGTPAGTKKISTLTKSLGAAVWDGPTLYFTAEQGIVAKIDSATDAVTTLATLPSTTTSPTNEIAFVGDAVYTVARQPPGLRAVFRIDVASGEVSTVKAGTDAKGLNALNGKLFFFFSESGSLKPMISDGTSAGTQTLLQTGVTNTSSAVRGGFVYFSTDTAVYRTDGTPAGTIAIADVSGTGFTVFKDLVLFAGTDALGIEPWRSDGTRAGTRMLRDIGYGTISTQPAQLTPVGASLFFIASHDDASPDISTARIWRSNGYDAQPVTAPGVQASIVAACRDGILFSSDGLYYADTSGNQKKLDAGHPPAACAGDRAILLFDTALKSINVVDGSFFTVPMPMTLQPRTPLAAGGRVFFTRMETISSESIWMTDGLTTTHLADGNATITFIGVAGSSLLYTTTGGIWSVPLTGGTPVNLGSPFGFSSQVTLGNTLFFFTRDASGPSALWKSDGTPAGTVAIGPVNSPGPMVAAGNRVFFLDNTILRVTSGVAGDLQTVTQTDGLPPGLGAAGGLVYFTKRDLNLGWELWSSDGTAAGTALAFDIVSGGDSSLPANFATTSTHLFFTATNFDGNELWALPYNATQPHRRAVR
jgi:ELWxxDGT repeat protein